MIRSPRVATAMNEGINTPFVVSFLTLLVSLSVILFILPLFDWK